MFLTNELMNVQAKDITSNLISIEEKLAILKRNGPVNSA